MTELFGGGGAPREVWGVEGGSGAGRGGGKSF